MSRRSIARKFALASTLMTVLLASCGQLSSSASTAPTGKAALPPSSLKTGQPYPIPRTKRLKGQQLTAPFCDDFNSFNTNLWETYKVNANWRSLNSAGTFEPSNLTVENGYLVMKLNYESGDVTSTTTPATYRSAVFRSVDAMGFGIYDFWMRTASTSKDPAVPGGRAPGTLADVNLYGEIDDTDSNVLPDSLIELRYGYSIPDYLLYTTLRTNQPENSVGVHPGINVAQGFHHHQWVWGPTSLKMYLDGQLVNELTDPSKVPQVAANLAMHLMPTNRPDLGTNLAGSKATRYTMVDKFCFTPTSPQEFVLTPSAPVLGQATTLDASGLAGTNFKWFVGTTQIASGQKATYTFPTVGSFQVKLTYTSLSGEAKVVTRDVNVTGADELPPLPAPASNPIYVPMPVATVGGSATFDLSDIEADSYQWSFSDGTTASGPFVEHTFAQKGRQTATVTVSRANGESQTYTTQVAVLPEIQNVVAQRATSSGMDVKFDLGEPVDGLQYQVDFSGGVPSENRSQFTKTFPKIGSYDYTVTISDARNTLTTQGLQGNLTAQGSGEAPIIYKQTSFQTIWRKAPIADFQVQANNGSNVPVVTISPSSPNGSVQFFAASLSKDTNQESSGLQYEWDFGNGQKSTESNPTTTYTELKPHVVTLKVTNKWGLSNTKRQIVFVRHVANDWRLNVKYTAISTASLGPQALDNELNLMERVQQLQKTNPAAAAQIFSEPQATPKMQAQASFDITNYYPYVLGPGHNIERGIHYPTADDGTRVNTFCNSYFMDVNGVRRIYPYNGDYINDNNHIFNWMGDYNTPPTFCSGLLILPGNIGRLPARSINDILIVTTRGLYNTRLNVLSTLSVPKLSVSVLPDDMLPGDQPSPIIRLNTMTDPVTGELVNVERVLIRESEAQNQYVEFDIPVLAMDKDGKMLNTLTGVFNAKFSDSSIVKPANAENVMVNGQALMRVKIYAPMFQSTGKEIDLSQVILGGPSDSCLSTDSSNLSAATKSYLFGCDIVTTTSKFPTERAPTNYVPLPPELAKHLKLGNHTFYGIHAERMAALITFTKMSYLVVHTAAEYTAPWVLAPEKYEDLGKVYDAANADGVISNDEKKELLKAAFDFASTLSGPGKPSLSNISASSRAGIGAVDKGIGEMITDDALTGLKMSERNAAVYNKLGDTAKALTECGQECIRDIDDSIIKLKNQGRSEAQALEDIEFLIDSPVTACSFGSLSLQVQSTNNCRIYRTAKLSDILSDVDTWSLSPISDKQKAMIYDKLKFVKQRSKQQNDLMRDDFVSREDALIAQWEANNGVSWPTITRADGSLMRATPHHIIPIKTGGANEWWNLMPVRHPHTGTIHGRGSALRQQLPYSITPGVISELVK